MYQLAVIGNPIGHSLSPLIFHEFARQAKISINYQKICIEDCSYRTINDIFINHNITAVNITAPFKECAYNLSSIQDESTFISKTANLLIKSDKNLKAYNTDGLGLIADFEHQNIYLQDKNILIIGSGSVVSSVLSEIYNANVATVDILARNDIKIKSLCEKFTFLQKYNETKAYDIVINTAPNDNVFLSSLNFSDNPIAYTMNYFMYDTFILQFKKHKNVRIYSGIGMLIQQAKYCFETIFQENVSCHQLYKLLD